MCVGIAILFVGTFAAAGIYFGCKIHGNVNRVE